MNATDQTIIDTSLEQLRSVHENMGQLWDADTIIAFYYRVLSSTIARNGPDVAKAITDMLSQNFDNTTKAHAALGMLGSSGTATDSGNAGAA
jgi:hypothetical protein